MPPPDAIFAGGDGREVARLIDAAWKSGSCAAARMVIHVATLDHLSSTYAELRKVAGRVDALLVNVARGVEQLESLRFESLNPTFLLTVAKPAAG